MAKKRRRKSSKPQPLFWADQILATLHAVGCCCCSSMLGVISLSLIDVKKLSVPKDLKPLADLLKNNGTSGMTPSLVFASIWILITIFSIWFVISLWKGKAWVFWYFIITNVIGIAVTIGIVLSSKTSTNMRFELSTWGIILTLYSFLRLTGKAGPKPN